MNSVKKIEHEDLPSLKNDEMIDETVIENRPEDQETPETHMLASYYNVLQSKISKQKTNLASNI
jgi:hypothetical protein